MVSSYMYGYDKTSFSSNNFSLASSNLTFDNNITGVEFNRLLESINFSFSRILLILFVIGLEILTVFGNVLVLLAIKVDSRLRTPSHYLMGSLAIADLMVGLLVLPFSSLQLFFNQWLFDDIFCEIWITSDVLCSTASIYLVTVISIDRYISITRPLRYSAIMTRCRIYIMIILAWILSLIVSLARLIGFKLPKQATLNKICEMSDNFTYALGSAALSYYIPLVVILFVYYKIFRLARAHMKFIKKSKNRLNQNNVNSKNNHAMNATNSCANIKLIEYNNKNNSKNCEEDVNEIKNIESNVSYAHFYCTCKPKSLNMRISNITSNPKFNRIKGNQIKKIDKATMQLSNHDINNNINENCHITSSSSFTSAKSLASSSENKNIILKNEICQKCNKIISKSLSSKIINMKKGSANNQMNIDSSINLTSKPKVNNGVSKRKKILNFLRKITKLKTEQKAAKTLGIVVGCLILCWLPFFVISPLDAFCKSCQIPKIIFTVFVWLGYCNSAMNPLIYCLSSQEFRNLQRYLEMQSEIHH